MDLFGGMLYNYEYKYLFLLMIQFLLITFIFSKFPDLKAFCCRGSGSKVGGSLAIGTSPSLFKKEANKQGTTPSEKFS